MAPELSEDLLDQVGVYISERMGLHFPRERRTDLERGLKRAAPDLGFPNAEAFARWLLLSPVTKRQIETLASRLTIGETYFFRDRTCFDLLETRILPDLIAKRRHAGRRIRIWSAGCATGEEPYSLAIALGRLVPDIQEWNITILATDINAVFLARAAEGVFGEWSFRETPSWIKERYFKAVGAGKRAILPELRKSVTFAFHNLAEDPYPSLLNNTNAMDVILCRNVLMYFSHRRQTEVVRRLSRCLVDGGMLVVSPIEMSAVDGAPLLQAGFPGASLFQKNARKGSAPAVPAAPGPPLPGSRPPQPAFAEAPETAAPPPAPRIEAAPGDGPVAGFAPYREATAFYERGLYRDAEEKIKTLAGGRGAPASALLSRIHANRGELAEALDLCAEAISADKVNPGYHYLLATIQQELGLTEESAASLKRAIYLDQNFVLAHFGLGTLALRLGKTGEAGKHFENARAALRNYGENDILPESEGVSARRMEEIIASMPREEALK
jgi:chemotaxis protein methyltransferase CheR